MRRIKKIICLFFTIVLYATLLFWATTHWIARVEEESSKVDRKQNWKAENLEAEINNSRIPVEVWGKASISMYLWIHILKGSTEIKYTGYNVGSLVSDDIQLNFKNGPSVIPSTVPSDVKNVVIILNGRAPDKIWFAQVWLDFLKSMKSLERAVLVLLGNEQCENEWILPYMKSKGGVIDVTFLVYDSKLVDDVEFFQWPLGVAEYRGFPDTPLSEVIKHLINAKRRYVANFVGTVYENSSREFLVKYIENEHLKHKIYLNYRKKWVLQETPQTKEDYMLALRESELTLSPVGMNAECYRIYEAMSLGSVPVIEDRVTRGSCDTEPLRLLKKYDAPVIWVKNWTELPALLHNEQKLSKAKLLKRRINLVSWHEKFKMSMKARFLNVLKKLILP